MSRTILIKFIFLEKKKTTDGKRQMLRAFLHGFLDS